MAWSWFRRSLPPTDRALALVALLAAGCGGEVDVPAAELGARHFAATAVSTSRFNRFSCATCHVKRAGEPVVALERWDSGYNLHGVTARRGWWGGGATRLIDAVNVCVTEFMGGRALDPTGDVARQLGAYLAEGAPLEDLPVAPMTVVRVATTLDGQVGNPVRGATIYAVGCVRCHGALHSGAGRLDPSISRVPDDTITAFPQNARHAFVEKVRHGRFFGIGGVMPFYSLEAMSDADLVDLLAYAGL